MSTGTDGLSQSAQQVFHRLSFDRRSFLRLSGTGVAAAALALSLASCRGLIPGGGSSSDPRSLSISWWAEAKLSELHVEVVNMFEKQNSGVTIRPQYQPQNGYDDKLSTQLAGGNAPDIFMLRRATFADYISRGAVRKLDDLVPGTLPFDKLPPELQKAAQYKGSWYAIPLGVASSPALIRDRVALDRLGIPAPEPDWIFDDFIAMLADVSEASGGGQYGSNDMAGSEYALTGYLAGDGKPLFTNDGGPGFTRDDITSWFELWDGLRRDKLVPEISVTSAQTGFSTDPLVKGLTTMTLAPSSKGINGYQSLVENQLELVSFPRRSSDGPTATSVGPIEWFALSSKLDQAKAKMAAELCLFFENDIDALTTLNLAHGAPIDETAREQTYETQSPINQMLYDNIAQIQELGPAPVAAYPPGATELLAELGNQNQQIGFGQVSVDQAVDTFFANVDRLLQGS